MPSFIVGVVKNGEDEEILGENIQTIGQVMTIIYDHNNGKYPTNWNYIPEENMIQVIVGNDIFFFFQNEN